MRHEFLYFCLAHATIWLCAQVSVEVRVPRKGEYGLEIFANDPEKEGDMFTHVCQYLCVYVDGPVDDLYGKFPGKEAEMDRRAGVREITAADLISDAGAETAETGDCLMSLLQHCCIVVCCYFSLPLITRVTD